MPEASNEPTSDPHEAVSGRLEELAALPPIADVVSREIRRMGRAWKVEAVKLLAHVVLTMLVMTVLGAGWLIFLGATASLGWYGWWCFRLKPTVKPYRFLTRRSVGSDESVAAKSEEAEYADWLIGSATDTE